MDQTSQHKNKISKRRRKSKRLIPLLNEEHLRNCWNMRAKNTVVPAWLSLRPKGTFR